MSFKTQIFLSIIFSVTSISTTYGQRILNDTISVTAGNYKDKRNNISIERVTDLTFYSRHHISWSQNSGALIYDLKITDVKTILNKAKGEGEINYSVELDGRNGVLSVKYSNKQAVIILSFEDWATGPIQLEYSIASFDPIN